MSRSFRDADGRGYDAPANRLRALASRIEATLDRYVEDLNFGEYDDLRESETKLLAYANLLTTENTDQFLNTEIVQAADCLAYIVQRIGGAS